jgi:hypothetical protein
VATTALGRQLTNAHRIAQARIGASTVAQAIAVYSLLDVEDLDATTAAWLSTMLALIQSQRVKSSAAAAQYLQALRIAEIGEPFTPRLARPAAQDQLSTSMLVTGPIGLKANMARGIPLTRAVDLSVAAVAGAAMRHTLNAARETISRTSRADTFIEHWERIVSSDACDWCQNLANERMSPDTQFESHDACHCMNEPQYTRI